MAHVEHYKMSDVKRMTNEYEREKECNNSDGRIDPNRTPLNYELRPRHFHKELAGKVERRLNQVKHSSRKDLNVVSTWIITCPPELQSEDDRKLFFKTAFDFCCNRYGDENVLNGYVHMDEKSPHMHTPIVPVIDGRVSSKALFTRKELMSFHKDLENEMFATFGRPNLILNGRTKGNYTVKELKERTKQEESLQQQQELLDLQHKHQLEKAVDLSKREEDLNASQNALNALRSNLDDREAKLDDRERNITQEVNKRVQRRNQAEQLSSNIEKPHRQGFDLDNFFS